MVTKPMKILAIGTLLVASFILPRRLIQIRFASQILDPEVAPSMPVAIVFGAGLSRSGNPTSVLRDRVATAVELYLSGKTDHLILSGTRTSDGYDEPGAMKRMAMDLGVPESDITLDEHGYRTYATCLRARDVFGVDQALLVTQRFHLPRALATCHAMGIQAHGIVADLRSYGRRVTQFWELREYPATLRALWESYITRPGIHEL
jgi:vancomycin permeability regulator SanA